MTVNLSNLATEAAPARHSGPAVVKMSIGLNSGTMTISPAAFDQIRAYLYRIAGINIGADKPYTVNELAEVVSREFGVTPDIKYLNARNEVLHAYSDHTKAHKVFGEGSGVDLKEGIRRMAAWAKKVGARQSQEFDNIEITEKLPDGWQVKKKAVV